MVLAPPWMPDVLATSRTYLRPPGVWFAPMGGFRSSPHLFGAGDPGTRTVPPGYRRGRSRTDGSHGLGDRDGPRGERGLAPAVRRRDLHRVGAGSGIGVRRRGRRGRRQVTEVPQVGDRVPGVG